MAVALASTDGKELVCATTSPDDESNRPVPLICDLQSRFAFGVVVIGGENRGCLRKRLVEARERGRHEWLLVRCILIIILCEMLVFSIVAFSIPFSSRSPSI